MRLSQCWWEMSRELVTSPEIFVTRGGLDWRKGSFRKIWFLNADDLTILVEQNFGLNIVFCGSLTAHPTLYLSMPPCL